MKILFFDIDGTLVGKDKKVSLKVQEAIQTVRQNGHLAFICTGRSKNYIGHILDIGFDGYIANAGAYIVYKDKVVNISSLEQKIVKKVEEVFDKYDIAYDHECENADYLKEKMISDMFDDKNEKIKKEKIKQFLVENNTLPMEEYKGETVFKISYTCESVEQLENAAKDLADDFLITVNPTFSKICGDLMLENTNKGTAIIKLVNHLGLNMEDTIGFGDSMNDIEMFKVCKESVVMGNGSDEIKQFATTICEGVENDGIYHELKRRNMI